MKSSYRNCFLADLLLQNCPETFLFLVLPLKTAFHARISPRPQGEKLKKETVFSELHPAGAVSSARMFPAKKFHIYEMMQQEQKCCSGKLFSIYPSPSERECEQECRVQCRIQSTEYRVEYRVQSRVQRVSRGFSQTCFADQCQWRNYLNYTNIRDKLTLPVVTVADGAERRLQHPNVDKKRRNKLSITWKRDVYYGWWRNTRRTEKTTTTKTGKTQHEKL